MDVIKCGKFSNNQTFHNYIVPADNLRDKFDMQNETLIRLNKKPRFVFIGDSITEGYDVNSYFGDSSFCVNRGIGGDVPMYIYRRFTADVLQLKPEYCVLLAGVNEIWSLDSAYETEVEFEKAYKTAFHYIIDYIEKISELCYNNSQKLVICSILPTFGRVRQFDKDANDLIIECNKEIQRIVKEKGYIFVDYHKHFCDRQGKQLKQNLSNDGVHLIPAGYDIMSQVLRNTLKLNGVII